jgi:hypothetical protein
MYPNHGNPAFALPRVGACVALLLLGCWGIVSLTRAMPDIIRQFARPCAECTLDAFGPPLVQAGYPSRRPVDIALGWESPPTPGGLVLNAPIVMRPSDSPTLGDTRNAMPSRGLTAGRFNFGSTPASGWLSPPADSPGLRWNDWPQSTPADQARVALNLAIGTTWPQGTVPHWRVAVQKDLERHFLQIEAYRTDAAGPPAVARPAGATDAFSGMAAAANDQFNLGGGSSPRAVVSQENRSPDAGNLVPGVNGFNSISTIRADASWSFAEAITPSIQYFRTAGAIDAPRYSWPGGRPNSAGVIAGVAYAPWDESSSPIRFLNLRLAAQYVAYTEFNGVARGTGVNNAVYLSLWGALHF